MSVPLDPTRKGKCWLDVTAMDGKVVHTVATQAVRADRVCAGMLTNMSPDYFVDYRYEFPEKGEKDKEGKEAAEFHDKHYEETRQSDGPTHDSMEIEGPEGRA